MKWLYLLAFILGTVACSPEKKDKGKTLKITPTEKSPATKGQDKGKSSANYTKQGALQNPCQAKDLPPIGPVQTALSQFLQDRIGPNAPIFDDLTKAVEGFSQAFLSSYPTNCDRSKILTALNDLKKESTASNLMDAGNEHLHRLAKIFLAISLHVEKDLKADLINIKRELEEKARHEFRTGYT